MTDDIDRIRRARAATPGSEPLAGIRASLAPAPDDEPPEESRGVRVLPALIAAALVVAGGVFTVAALRPADTGTLGAPGETAPAPAPSDQATWVSTVDPSSPGEPASCDPVVVSVVNPDGTGGVVTYTVVTACGEDGTTATYPVSAAIGPASVVSSFDASDLTHVQLARYADVPVKPGADWITLAMPELGVSVKYPAGWTIAAENGQIVSSDKPGCAAALSAYGTAMLKYQHCTWYIVAPSGDRLALTALMGNTVPSSPRAPADATVLGTVPGMTGGPGAYQGQFQSSTCPAIPGVQPASAPVPGTTQTYTLHYGPDGVTITAQPSPSPTQAASPSGSDTSVVVSVSEPAATPSDGQLMVDPTSPAVISSGEPVASWCSFTAAWDSSSVIVIESDLGQVLALTTNTVVTQPFLVGTGKPALDTYDLGLWHPQVDEATGETTGQFLQFGYDSAGSPNKAPTPDERQVMIAILGSLATTK